MFRKLVSNLAFSPALVGQIGFYAKRLRKEEITRRIGLIFTALALVVQAFTVFSPPEAANAASAQDLIRGGVKTHAEFMANYDANTNNIRDLFTAVGITRAEVMAATKKITINSKDIPISFGMNSHFSAAQGERQYNFPLARGGTGTVYYTPLALWDTGANVKTGSYYEAFVGNSAKAGWFSIMLRCGNLDLKKPPITPPCPTGTTGIYPNCVVPPKKCTIPGKTTLSSSDPNCREVAQPSAICSSLNVVKIIDDYQMTGNVSTSGGATVSKYIYTVKRDGKVVDTVTHSSKSLTDQANTHQTAVGNYTIDLAVATSAGNVNCNKAFYITAPQKCQFNPELLKSDADCQPCPGDETIWIKSKDCAAQIIYTKKATNITQNNVDATSTTARSGDLIAYTIKVENIGKAETTVMPKEYLQDVSEYTNLTDQGGGIYNDDAKTLSWQSFELAPKTSQERVYTVKVLDSIPTSGQGLSNKTSFDCKIDNTFGNTVSINIDCPPQKVVVEQITNELPHTGPRENMMFAGILLAIVTYFYLRSRQMKQEIRLIRRDFNAGTI